MVPKETSEPIEMVLQVQNDEELAKFYHDFHIEDTDPLDIYLKSEFCTNYMDEIYGVKEEFNTLLYDLDMNNDMDIINPTDAFEATLQYNNSSKSTFTSFPYFSQVESGVSIFVCTR